MEVDRRIGGRRLAPGGDLGPAAGGELGAERGSGSKGHEVHRGDFVPRA